MTETDKRAVGLQRATLHVISCFQRIWRAKAITVKAEWFLQIIFIFKIYIVWVWLWI